jgi:hypothetical protein
MYDKKCCPNCKTNLLIYLGNWDDDTSPTVEGFTCPKCNQSFLLGYVDELYEIILTHCEIEEDENGVDIAYNLLEGGTYKGLNLSAFLQEHAYLEVGKEYCDSSMAQLLTKEYRDPSVMAQLLAEVLDDATGDIEGKKRVWPIRAELYRKIATTIGYKNE